MRRFVRFCGLSLAPVVFLAACGPQGGSPEAADRVVTQPAAEVVTPVDPSPVVEPDHPDVDFDVSPPTAPACGDNSPVQATVSWEVRNTAVGEVRVEVADPGQENWKLLSVAGRQGEVETGPWVADGTRFRLIHSATGEQLAIRQVQGDSCADGGAG